MRTSIPVTALAPVAMLAGFLQAEDARPQAGETQAGPARRQDHHLRRQADRQRHHPDFRRQDRGTLAPARKSRSRPATPRLTRATNSPCPAWSNVHSHVGGSGDINEMVYQTNPELRVLDVIRPNNEQLKVARGRRRHHHLLHPRQRHQHGRLGRSHEDRPRHPRRGGHSLCLACSRSPRPATPSVRAARLARAGWA